MNKSYKCLSTKARSLYVLIPIIRCQISNKKFYVYILKDTQNDDLFPDIVFTLSPLWDGWYQNRCIYR